MFGETVIVREYGGTPVICRVWEVTQSRIYVCTKETFETLKKLNGKPFPSNCFPVAFPKQDVFQYSSNIDLTSKSIWSKLTAYGK